MTPAPNDTDNLAKAVRRKQARALRHKVEGDDSIAHGLAWIGALGWTIAMPSLLGAFAGRWLDHILASKALWTSALLVVGLASGCAMAWRRIRP